MADATPEAPHKADAGTAAPPASQPAAGSCGEIVAITHRRVLNISVPIVLSNATIPLLGLVDTAVVGQLGSAAPVGAVALGATILTTLFWAFGFLRLGTVGLASQAIGRGDHGEVSALLSRCLLFAGGVGVLLIVLQAPLFWVALSLAGPSDAVSGLTQQYLAVRIWSAPAMIAMYGLSGWLIAKERSRAFMVVQIWTNGLNMLLDVWFVFGLAWGVGGVALASVIAEWSGAALGLWFCRDAFLGGAWRDWARVLDRARLRHMTVVNVDIMIRSLLLQAIFTSFVFLGARQDDVHLATNQILMQVMMIASFGLDGFAAAAETLVGQAFGRRDQRIFRRAVQLTFVWGGVVVVVMAVFFALAGPLMIDLMTTAEDVRQTARVFLPYIVVGALAGWAGWMLDGVFIGATASRDMRNMMIVSALIYGGAVAALVPVFGNHGLWAALIISFIARGVTLAMRYPTLDRQLV